MTRVGMIIVCRYDSRRLPGKILEEVGGRTILELIYERLRQTRRAEDIVVATSVEASDDPIEALCRARGMGCFRGSLADVAGRFLACAKRFGFDYAGRINGDNLFVDIPTVQRALRLAESGEYDFVTNVPGRTFPFGMSVEVVRTAFFEEVMRGVEDRRLREHVTLMLYENEELGRRCGILCEGLPEAKGVQFAIDEAADLARARAMMGYMNREHIYYHLPDLLDLLERVSGSGLGHRKRDDAA